LGSATNSRRRPGLSQHCDVIQLRRAGWKIVVVTNGPATYQREKIALTGLSELIDGSCISKLIGATKPSLAIFEAAAALAGCPLAGWMVGDSADHDIGGGRAAGLDTIWLSRGRRWEQPEFSPSHICDSVFDAVGVMLTS
jgi:putative hydrolase of the HAD superfamily